MNASLAAVPGSSDRFRLRGSPRARRIWREASRPGRSTGTRKARNGGRHHEPLSAVGNMPVELVSCWRARLCRPSLAPPSAPTNAKRMGSICAPPESGAVWIRYGNFIPPSMVAAMKPNCFRAARLMTCSHVVQGSPAQGPRPASAQAWSTATALDPHAEVAMQSLAGMLACLWLASWEPPYSGRRRGVRRPSACVNLGGCRSTPGPSGGGQRLSISASEKLIGVGRHGYDGPWSRSWQ